VDCKTLEFLAGDGDFDGKGRERGLDITLRKPEELCLTGVYTIDRA